MNHESISPKVYQAQGFSKLLLFIFNKSLVNTYTKYIYFNIKKKPATKDNHNIDNPLVLGLNTCFANKLQ